MNKINETIQRGDCFKLLAACFYEPDKKLFVEEQVGGKLGTLLDSWSKDSAVAARKMQNGLEGLGQEKMSIDHAALFVGPFELIAAPYGSVYIEKSRRVMGESSVNAARYYQEADLSVDIKEPPDHIVIELEFMYYLCSKEANAATDGIMDEAGKFWDMQVRFFHGAMRPWITEFCRTIRAGTDNEFYSNLADCLSSFMIWCEDVYAGTN